METVYDQVFVVVFGWKAFQTGRSRALFVYPVRLRVCRRSVYGSAALVKVVPPPPVASTWTMLASPETAALRKHEANPCSLPALEKSKCVQRPENGRIRLANRRTKARRSSSRNVRRPSPRHRAEKEKSVLATPARSHRNRLQKFVQGHSDFLWEQPL